MKAASPSSTESLRSTPVFNETAPLITLPGIGPQKAGQLAGYGLNNIADLLNHTPKTYLDLSRVSSSISYEEPRLYQATVLRCSNRYHKPKKTTTSISIECCGKPCQIILFNQPYLKNQLQAGNTLSFLGLAQHFKNKIIFTQPRLLLSDHPHCLPIYPTIGPFSSEWLRKRINSALNALQEVSESIPDYLLRIHKLPGLLNGWQSMHEPKDVLAGYTARNLFLLRLAYHEFLLFHLQLAVIRRQLREQARHHTYRLDKPFKQLIQKRIPFRLTLSQKKVLRDIMADLNSPKTMQRLLCGDVGSGKTVVAFVAILAALYAKHQAALLVPTDLLARQHYHNAVSFFPDYTVGLLTGDMPTKEALTTRKKLEKGLIGLVIGTHALLQSHIHFADLSLIVIDEQHRFGVLQRAALQAKSTGLDLLAISATPIPRTLLLSHYSDLSTSVINELPPGRKPINTTRIIWDERKKFYQTVRDRVINGEKAYIVVPRVDYDEENPEITSIEQMGITLRKIFTPESIGIVHGRINTQQKQSAMQDFFQGQTRVLLATSVIEVGIDDQEVSIMVIENADRFGLAALHQLRGRIGRGERHSDCFLISSPQATPEGLERISILCESSDGFVIAQKDLAMRGGGIIAGSEQIGGPSFRHGDPFTNRELFLRARQDVAKIMLMANPPGELSKLIHAFEEEVSMISFS